MKEAVMAVTAEHIGYIYANEWEHARRRLSYLEQCLDPETFRRMDRLGVDRGWQCLEVGAGGGSAAKWLCDRVGPTGTVVATDIDTRFLEELDHWNLRVLTHDIVRDPLPGEAFDLIHARLVLIHIPERDDVIRRLMASLRPGGSLLLEELDAFSVEASEHGLFGRVYRANWRAGEKAGIARNWARRLPRLLTANGLHEVGGEADVPLFNGGSTMAQLLKLTFEQIHDQIVAAGCTPRDLAVLDERLDCPEVWFTGPAFVAAWGRKPGTQDR